MKHCPHLGMSACNVIARKSVKLLFLAVLRASSSLRHPLTSLWGPQPGKWQKKLETEQWVVGYQMGRLPAVQDGFPVFGRKYCCGRSKRGDKSGKKEDNSFCNHHIMLLQSERPHNEAVL